jgi:hypothetical protein
MTQPEGDGSDQVAQATLAPSTMTACSMLVMASVL